MQTNSKKSTSDPILLYRDKIVSDLRQKLAHLPKRLLQPDTVRDVIKHYPFQTMGVAAVLGVVSSGVVAEREASQETQPPQKRARRKKMKYRVKRLTKKILQLLMMASRPYVGNVTKIVKDVI